MLCTYCKTETTDIVICDFCKADLTKPRPKKDPMLDDSASEFTQPELEKIHTYDLLRLLSHIRYERSDMYQTMQAVRKAPDISKQTDYEEINAYGQQQYRELTARKNVIEQILVDRMGYFPKRVDDKLLAALKHKINQSKD